MADPADPYAGWTEEPAAPSAPGDQYAGWTEEPAGASPAPVAAATARPDVSAPEPVDTGFAPIDFETFGLPEETEQQRTEAEIVRERIGKMSLITTENGIDKHASILDLARKTGLDFNTVAARFDEIAEGHRVAQTDPVLWQRTNPQLADLVLRDVRLTPLVMRDPGLNRVSKALNAITGFMFEPWAPHLAPPEAVEAAKAKQEAFRIKEPGPKAFKQDEKSQAIVEGGWQDRAIVPFLRAKETSAALNADLMWFDIMRRGGPGAPGTPQLEALAHDWELAGQPRDYQEGALGQIATDAAAGIASSLVPLESTIKGGGAGALAAGAFGAISGAIATRSPAGAIEGFNLAVGTGLSLGAKGGAFLGSFRLEGGGAYKELLRYRTDDGHPLSNEAATGGALLYATLAASIELGSMGPALKALGPAGEFIRTGSRKAAVAALLKNPAFLASARRLGKNWLAATAAEGAEETLQAMTKDAVTYFTASLQAGEFQQGRHGQGGAVNVPGAIEEGATALAAAGVTSTVSGGAHIAQSKLLTDRARESARVVDVVADLDESPTLLANPEATAESLQGMGLGKSMFLGPREFISFNQSQNINPEQAAEGLLGPGGPKALQEALAAGVPLEVPLEAYLEKLPAETRKALKPFTTTAPDLAPPAAIDQTEFDAAVKQVVEGFEKGEGLDAKTDGEAAFLDAAEKQLASVSGDTKTARQNMELMRATVRVWAERFGQSADELFANLAVTVESGQHQSSREQLERRAADLGLDRAEELFRDENTGLPNELAFERTQAPADKPLVARVAVEGIKWLNDTTSHERADLLYRAVAVALHGAGVTPFKVGGDFAFYVEDEAKLRAALEKARASMPAQLRGFAITGAVGATLSESGGKLEAEHQAAVEKGERANPRAEHHELVDEQGNPETLPPERPKGIPAGVDPHTIDIPTTKASAVIDPSLVDYAKGLSPADYFNKAYKDQGTGEWTARGWAALQRKAHVASLDLAGLRGANTRFGKATGNLMLETMGLVAKRLGGEKFDFAHLHGDEYAAQSDDLEALEAFVEELRAVLTEHPVQYQESETGKLTPVPVTFHDGFGERSLESADRDLNRRKAARKKARQAGLDVRRSGRSGPVADLGAKGSGNREGDSGAEGEAVQADQFEAIRLRVARARSTKKHWKKLLTYFEEGAKGEFPDVPWRIESAAARYGFVDPKGFPGDEAGRDLRRRAAGAKTKAGGDAAARRAVREGVGQVGAARESRGKLLRGEALFYQFPTPEESLENMQAERVVRDWASERGAKVVDSKALLIEQLKKAFGGAAPFDTVVVVANDGSLTFSNFAEAVTYISDPPGERTILGVYATKPGVGPGERTDDAALDNADRLRAQGLFGSRELFPKGESGTADIPQSKNLPGQAEAEGALKVWTLESAGKEKGDQARGLTQMYNEGLHRIYRVVLNPNADRSTFLHESAHIFLDMMSNLALRPDAPQRVRDDYAAVLKFLGAKSAKDIEPKANDEKDPARLRHEKFARSFEAYLFEGMAPSERLAGAFARFRLWLSRVYKTLTQLDAPLNDSIRGVFDRMLATDAEIEAYRKRQGAAKPMARDTLGMTPEEYEAHQARNFEVTANATKQADKRVQKAVQRELEGWWKEELRTEVTKAKKEYELLPARQVQQAIANRGEIKVGPLDEAKVKQALGKLSKKVKTEKGGADPGPIADFFGFATAKEMLEALQQLPERDAWAAEQAEQRMRERHPEVLDEREKLREAIGEDLHGKGAEDYLLRELAALWTKVGKPGESVWAPSMAPIEAEKKAAREIVRNRMVGRLDPEAALRAERRAADQAIEAAAKGNYPKAFSLYRQRMLNFYLWRELTAAREQREQFIKLAEQMSAEKAQAKLRKASPVYADNAIALLTELGFMERDPDAEGFSVESVIAQMEADLMPIGIDPERLPAALRKLSVYGRGRPHGRAWQVLSVSEMGEVKDALASITAAAAGATMALDDRQKVDKEQRIADMLDEAARHLPPLPPPVTPGAEFLPQHIGGKLTAWDAEFTRQEVMIDWLTGGDLTGPIFRSLVLPLQRAKHDEVDLLNTAVKPAVKAFDKMPRSVKSRSGEEIDGKALFPGHTARVAPPQRRWEFLVMLLNMGNESNKQRLLEGRNITEKEVVDAALKLGITKEEYDWVQSVWDSLETLKEKAFALETRTTGIVPEEIVATPLNTPFGQYRGGYFPAVYDRTTAVGARQELAQFQDGTYTSLGTSHGYLKSRVQDFSDIIALSPSSIYRHLAQVAHDIAFREPVRSVAGLIIDKRVKAMLVARLGKEREATFRGWLADIAQNGGAQSGTNVPAVVRFAGALRGMLAVSALGGSLKNALEDFVTGIAMAVPGSDLKSTFMAKGVAAVTASPVDAPREAEAKSGELRTRRGQIARELLSNISELIAKTPLGKGYFRFAKDHAFAFHEVVDRQVSTAIWLGAYHQALDGAPLATPKQEEEAIIFADKTVRLLLPSHSVVDTSALLRDKGMVAAMLVFHRFFNTAYNVMRTKMGRDLVSKRSARASGAVLGMVFAFAILGSLARGQGPDPGEPWGLWFLRKMTTGFAGMFPFAGEGAEGGWYALVEFLGGGHGGKKREPRNNSIVGMLAGLWQLAAKAGDGDKDADDRVKAAIKGLGFVAEQPVGQPLATGGYLYDVGVGEVEPRGTGDVAGGLLYGQRDGQPTNVPTLIQDIIEHGWGEGLEEHPGPR
jgi:GGDEF domain-containing protein